MNPPVTALSSVITKVIVSPSSALAGAIVTAAGTVASGLPFTWWFGSADSPACARDASWPSTSFSVAPEIRCTMLPFPAGFG